MNSFELFQAALELATDHEQDAYVDRATENDPKLRAEVKSLLRAHRLADEKFLINEAVKTKKAIETLQSISVSLGHSLRDSAKAIEKIRELLGAHPDPKVITTIDHYCLLEVVGAGGFGLVFKAKDQILDRLVAIKMLVSGESRETAIANQFLQEARLAAAVQHENVVNIHSVQDSTIPYIVMEYIDGPTLQSFVDSEGPLDFPSLFDMVQRIASGLAAAHDRGMVHRDIKPGNILVQTDRDLKPKLTDFGLAHPVSDTNRLTTDRFEGTPLYASPEQASKGQIDARSDLFSLGSVIYFMATGRPPFFGKTTAEVLQQVLASSPTPIKQIRPSVPNWFCKIVERLHAKDPADRIQSANELIQLLKLQSREASASRSHTVNEGPKNKRIGGNRIWAALAAGIAGITILVASSWFAANRPQRSSLLPKPEPVDVPPSGEKPSSDSIDNLPDEFAIKRTVLEELPAWQLPEGVPLPLSIPSSADQAKETQTRWAQYLGQPEFSATSVGLNFALIPPGDFEKTFTRNRDGEIHPSMPTVRYRLTKPYRLATTEVTVEQFQAFVEETTYTTDAEQLGFACATNTYLAPKLTWKNTGRAIQPNEPVCMVTEQDAREFCKWMSKKENRRFRLPTEAEWIHAVRAGTESRFVFGADHTSVEQGAWSFENSGVQPKPVGTLAATPLGLHDMLGNMWERTSDWMEHHAMYPYLQRVNPQGSPISNTIGGCFIEQRQFLHADLVVGNWSTPSAAIGFRVVEEIEESSSDNWTTQSLIPSTQLTMSPTALTTRPAKLDGVSSWSLCVAGIRSLKPSTPAWNPQTKQWLVGGDEGDITVLNETGEFVEKLMGPWSRSEIKVSNDGQWVVAKVANGSLVEHLYVWNWPERKLKTVLPIDGRFWAISPDSSKLVFAKQNRGPWNNWGAYELNLTTGELHSLMIPRLVEVFAWTNRADRIVCQTKVDEDTALELLEYPSMRLVKSIPSQRITELAISPDAKQFAIARMSGQVIGVYDLETLTELKTIPVELNQFQSCQWLDNDRLLVCDLNSQRVVRVSTSETLVTVQSEGLFTCAPCFCEAQNILASSVAFSQESESQAICAFDVNSERLLTKWPALRSDSELLPGVFNQSLIFAENDRFRSFDLSSSQWKEAPPWRDQMKLIDSSAVKPRAIDPKRQKIAVVENNQLIQLDLKQNTHRSIELPMMDGLESVLLVYSSDGRKIACLAVDVCGYYRCLVLDTSTGERLSELLGSRIKFVSLEWSSDDKYIAALTHPDSIQLIVWDAVSGEPNVTSQVPTPPRQHLALFEDQLRFSPADKAYLVVSGPFVYRFDLDSRQWTVAKHNKIPAVERQIWVNHSQTRLVNSFGSRFHHLCTGKTFDFLGELDAPGTKALWTQDDSSILLNHSLFGLKSYASKTLDHIGSLLPNLPNDHWLACSPDGHYRGSEGIEAMIAYVVIQDDGSQKTYTPAQFAERFGWKNSSDSVVLLPQK